MDNEQMTIINIYIALFLEVTKSAIELCHQKTSIKS